MRSYKSLVESLPSREVVFAISSFNPPTIEQHRFVQLVTSVARQRKADHCIFTECDQSKQFLTTSRKHHYLNIAFPNVRFDGRAHSIVEAVQLLSRYHVKTMLQGRHQPLDESLNVNIIDCRRYVTESHEPEMRRHAKEANFESFKRGLPLGFRDIDARRLMNDLRESFGMDVQKEHVPITVDQLREKYFQGTIFRVGDLVESNGVEMVIVKRGTNHLLCKDSEGNVQNKFLHEVVAR